MTHSPSSQTHHPQSRRRFLRTLAGSAAALGVSGATGVASAQPTGPEPTDSRSERATPFPQEGRMAQAGGMTLALNPGRIGISVGQMEAIELADEYGFGAVTPDAGYLAGLGDSEMSALKDEMADRNLVFSAAGVPVQFREDRETFRRDLLDLPAHAKTLARAGVTRAGTWIMPTHADRTYHQNFELHVRRLRPVARILQDHGIRFGLEYVASPDLYIRDRYPFVHDLAETMDLIEEIGYDNMGLILDAWHWHFAEDGREALLDLSPEDVVVVDLNDAPDVPIAEQQDTVRRLPTTTGVIDLETFLTALSETGYTGPVRAEPFDDSLGEMGPEKAVARTAETMRAALDLLPG